MQAITNQLKRLQKRSKQRVYIIPTRFGFIFALFLIVMLLGAINYSNSMGHLLVFLLASLAHTVMLYTHRNINRLTLKRTHAEAVFCGETAVFNVVFNNPSDKTLYQLSVFSRAEKINGFNPLKLLQTDNEQGVIHAILPHESANTAVLVKTTARGYLPLPQLKVSTTFPLGLFTSWTYFYATTHALVYPKPAGDLPLPEATDQGDQFLHQNTAGLDDFAGLKDYRQGDAAHHIAWKALAKDNQLRTKQFSSLQSGRRRLDWYQTQGDTETRISQLTQWLLESEKTHTATQLILPNQTIDYGSGEAHRHRCLTALALYDA